MWNQASSEGISELIVEPVCTFKILVNRWVFTIIFTIFLKTLIIYHRVYTDYRFSNVQILDESNKN